MKTALIYEHLERIANLLRTDTRKAGLAKGLQPVQVEALNYLAHCNRYSDTPAAVSEYLGLTKGTVSQTLTVLEHAGFIEKRPDAKDRRVVHLKMTERGEALVAKAIPPQILQAALELTDVDAQESVLEGLAKVLQAMQKANQLRSFGVCRACRHHRIEAGDQHRCNLTGESLSELDSGKICREHECVF